MWHSYSSCEDGNGALDEEESGVGLTLIKSCIPPPIFVVVYCQSDDDRLDARRFRSMGLHEELLELRCRKATRGNTAVGGCARRGKRWNCLGASECETLSSETDMPYVIAFEETVQERKLSELIATLLSRSVQPEINEDGAMAGPSTQLVVLQFPFDNLWFAVLMSIGKKMSISKYAGGCHLMASEFFLHAITWRFFTCHLLIVSPFTFQFCRGGVGIRYPVRCAFESVHFRVF